MYSSLLEQSLSEVSWTVEMTHSFLVPQFRLGSLKLQEVPSPAEVVKELIGYCLDSLGKLRAKTEHLQRENERLFSSWSDVEKR